MQQNLFTIQLLKTFAYTLALQFHLQVFLRALFHLQSTWRKVQELGLTQLYKENDDVMLFVGMIDAAAFLPLTDVAAGIDILRANMPNGNGEHCKLM